MTIKQMREKLKIKRLTEEESKAQIEKGKKIAAFGIIIFLAGLGITGFIIVMLIILFTMI